MHDFYPSKFERDIEDEEEDIPELDAQFDEVPIQIQIGDYDFIQIMPNADDSDTSDSSGDDFQIINEENPSDSDFTDNDSADEPIADEWKNEGEPSTVHRRAIDEYDEDIEEDEVIKKIITEIKKPRSKPPDISTEDYVVDLSFHPEQDILAVGLVTGDILIYKYSNEENTLLHTHEVHTKAIRDIEFSIDGKELFSCSRDKSIMITDFETGKLKRFWNNAHDEPIYTLTVIDENIFATGDDDGVVKLWDAREKEVRPIFSLKEVEDNISSITTNNQKRLLVCSSGDGYLTTINIAQKKLFVQSEPYEEELTCTGVFRNDSKLIAGSSKGNFFTFNWSQFGYHNDAFSGPSTGVSSMIPITERIAITAGEDGIIRAMHMVPGRVLGIVGQHTLAVEAMDINCGGDIIASCSNDNDIRFWNIKYFEDFDDIKYNEKPSKTAKQHNLPSSQYADRGDFFADLA